MKVITITKYECEKCGHQHITEQAAHECEALPIKYDRGVKVGDEVLITKGDGSVSEHSSHCFLFGRHNRRVLNLDVHYICIR